MSPTLTSCEPAAGRHYPDRTLKVTLKDSTSSFEVRPGESVLNAALRQGVMLPYSCKNGTCGSCKGRLVSGEVEYPFHPPLALTPEEIDQGHALLCQAVPTGDLLVEAREIAAVRDIQVRMFPVRVKEKQLLAPNVMLLRLKLPAAQRLQFLAGQYVDALISNGKRRAFSIASSPSQEDEIELHIRHVDGGDFTGWVFDELKERSILRLEGPLGTFFVRHDQPQRPMIMVGGGTGFAPLKSMIESLLEHDDRRPIHLYWGARTPAGLYMDELPQKWAEEYPHIEYRRAISEPVGEEAPECYAGFVHQAVLDDHPDLSGFDVYMSGPPAMIDSAKRAFLKARVEEGRLFYDSFEFGLDVPVSVLVKPH